MTYVPSSRNILWPLFSMQINAWMKFNVKVKYAEKQKLIYCRLNIEHDSHNWKQAIIWAILISIIFVFQLFIIVFLKHLIYKGTIKCARLIYGKENDSIHKNDYNNIDHNAISFIVSLFNTRRMCHHWPRTRQLL